MNSGVWTRAVGLGIRTDFRGCRKWVGGGRKAEEKRDQRRSGVHGAVFLNPQKSILSRYGNELWSNGLGPAFISKGGWSKGSEGEAEPVGLWLLRSWWGGSVVLWEKASQVGDGEGGRVWS